MLVNFLTATGLIAIMLAMGLRVTLGEILASIRRFRAVAVGVVANFALVPAATIALLYLFNPDPMVSVGFLVLASCPGAPVGPPFTASARGDVSYATGQMVILAGLSALLSPLLLSLFVARLLPESPLHIDYLAIVRTLLLSQIAPLAIGLAIHHWAPKLTSRIVRPVGLAANILLLCAVVALLAGEHEFLLSIRMRGWAAMCLLLLSSLGIGWLCGGPCRATRKALAVTTSARNAAVALVIVANDFADTAAVTAVVAYALVSVFGTLGCAVLLAKVPEFNSARSP